MKTETIFLGSKADNGEIKVIMDNCILHKISYKELLNNVEIEFDDSYHVLSDYLTPAVRSTLLANPNLIDNSKSSINLIVCNGFVVGRNMLMPTKLKIKNSIIMAQSGGSYEVNDKFQGQGLGSFAFKDSIFNSEYEVYIGQLYSTTAIAIVRKLGLIVFELPSFYKLCRSRIILEAKGLKGLNLKFCAAVVDGLLRFIDVPNLYRLRKLNSKFVVKKVNTVPKWVDEITLNDGHDYMEVHDANWLQWCLDNRFTECSHDRNSFFVVYDKEGNPKGFFMTKERYEEKQGAYRRITRGTIVEWGSYDEDELSEIDLNLLAVYSFGSNVDNITTVLSNSTFEKKMKRMGFIRHGNYQMTVKPGCIKHEDISEQKKWRIRYGGCNTIVF